MMILVTYHEVLLVSLYHLVDAAGKAMDLTLTDFNNSAFDVAVDKACF
jgi:hypothetical protein